MSLESGVYLVEKTIDPTMFKCIKGPDCDVGGAIGTGVSGKTIGQTMSKRYTNSSSGVGRGMGVSEISSIITSEGQLESEDGPKRASVFYDHFGNPVIKLYIYDKNEPISQREGNKIRIASFEMIEEGSVSLVRYGEHDSIESYFVPTSMGRELIKNRLEKNADMYWKTRGTRKGRCPRCDNHKIILNENFLIIQTGIDTKGLEMITKISERNPTKLILRPKTTTADFNKDIYGALVETYEHLKWLFFR